ncbi:YbaB/EbfC family nucleoid-associated protein [Nocardia sp. CC227C]|uniref:YbaB/EbfC family nucleoid-associated protein n=1 Tax=Nocardia sp. CC227C TaxID=3044562 RepID=UPI00278C5F74|nr:YbaB/EbfC family nucleoid-associated protein [Nocardia sp. CC227C]
MVGSMDELQARVQQQVYRMQDLREAMSGVRGRETSEDGNVTVEVDGNGALRDLAFTSGISRLTPDELERAVVGTAAAAARTAFEQRADLVRRFTDELAP